MLRASIAVSIHTISLWRLSEIMDNLVPHALTLAILAVSCAPYFHARVMARRGGLR